MSVKLYYFDGRGIGEPIRMVLSYGGADWEDIRVPYNKFPPTLPEDIKAKGRWGTVPVAEFEGKSLTQSGAIMRYFGKKFNLVPADPYQAALSDEYMDAIKDFLFTCFYPAFTAEGSNKEETMKQAIKTSKAKFWDVFESIAKANGGKHLAGSSTSLADIHLAYCMNHIQVLIGVDLTEGYPNLKNVTEAVLNHPKIKAWMEKRPKTKY